MSSLFIMLVSSIAGGIGWWLGDFFGFVPALVLSTVASIFGLYYGWKWNRELFC
ncbi:MAG: hypothetical protein KDM91_15310 [Verrucomicrobiae bacterium]|nr:hypothetical protein [Verrucomicrobiae bacterium]MCB1236434.1 hypothetical protein [Verrucomicrobiae bacterium]MCP5540786.1 hypothetical protein [Akkermansiaceae bacterium]MCP5551310.1 hypothetical protein [Akkermansiaceae bacterium]